MKLNLKGPRMIEGVLYQEGIQEIPDDVADHWFLRALIASGDAMVMDGGSSTSQIKFDKKELEKKSDVAVDQNKSMANDSTLNQSFSSTSTKKK